MVGGIVYHRECAPKKEQNSEVVKAEKKAKEQFKKDMSGHGTVESYNAYEGEIIKNLEDKVKDSGVTFDEFAGALSTVNKKTQTPVYGKKKRVKK